MKLYTKQGDNLKTKIFDREVYKDDIIIDVIGAIDEVQAHLMVASNFIDRIDIKKKLLAICNDFFKISFDLLNNKSSFEIGNVEALESLIDQYYRPQNAFVIPGQTKASSLLHLARTVVRRCERVIVSYARGNKINDVILKYINRLSDLLFAWALDIEEN